MADATIDGLDTLASVDRTADKLPIWDTSDSQTKEATINSMLGFSGGNPVSTSDTQTLTNKTLTTPTITVLDNALTIQDNSDATKQLQLQLSGITTGTTRTLTIPDATTTLVGTDTTQTLTNKTLTSPTINTATISNPTLTTDTVNEHTAANGVTVDGLNIKDSKLNTNNSVVAANITAGAVTPEKLVSGTGTGWGWQSWTPTWTNLTVGNGTVTAYYTQIGKTVIARVTFVMGATSSISGSVSFTLPVTAASYPGTSNINPIGNVRFFETGASSYDGVATFTSTTSAGLFVFNASATYVTFTALSSAIPFTWAGASNDEIACRLVYEAA